MNELSIIVTETYQGHRIEFRKSDGFINLTALCRAFGKKPNDLMQMLSTKQLLTFVDEDLGKLRESPVVVSEGHKGGNWIHPQLAIAACRWIDDEFALWCDWRIKKIVDGEKILVDAPAASSPRAVIREFTLLITEFHRDGAFVSLTDICRDYCALPLPWWLTRAARKSRNPTAS